MCTGTEDGRWDDSMILSLGDLGEAVDSRDEDMFIGMPLLGGKGGEGFDKTMPLLKACDNSAGREERSTLDLVSANSPTTNKVTTQLS